MRRAAEYKKSIAPHVLLLLWAFLLQVSVMLAEDFQPTVSWFCPPEGFELTVRTTQPFFGAIHPADRYHGCRINGTGGTETHHRIPYYTGQSCNVRYNPISDAYTVQIEVNEHNVLILQQDRIFDLICGNKKVPGANKTSFTTAKILQVFQKGTKGGFTLSVESGNAPLSEVSYGTAYSLRVRKNHKSSGSIKALFKVADCFAYGMNNTSVQLIDSYGCSVDRSLISDFRYVGGFAEADIPAMFRFPGTNNLEFECRIFVCQLSGQCKVDPSAQANCRGPKGVELDDEARKMGRVTELLEREQFEQDNLSGEQISNISVTVTVGKKNAESVISAADSSLQPVPLCVSPADLLLLYKLCIALCVMFLAGCCMNIFCCFCVSGGKKRGKKSKLDKPEKAVINGTIGSRDFWIKDHSSIVEMGFVRSTTNGNDSSAEQNRRLPLASYASVRQKVHRPLNQLPLHFSGDAAEAPSPRSPASLRPSTFGSRLFMMPSATIETDLNSPGSSIVERNAKFLMKNDELLTPSSPINIFLPHSNENEKEAYSIL